MYWKSHKCPLIGTGQPTWHTPRTEYCTESEKVVYVLVWKELLDDMVKLKKKGSKKVFKYNITFFWKINIYMFI